MSGRAMARIGLRMMPTFPSPSLKFRTAGFPQYGSKAGMSDGAFPNGAGYCVAWFASVLRAPRLHRRDPRTVPRFVARLSTSVRADYSALPQGPSLRSGFYCPSPSSLNRPHPSHSRARPDFTALRFIRDAFAVRCRLGDPRVVPGFHGTFLLDMLSSKTAGSPPAAFAQFFADVAGLRPDSKGSALPSIPIIRFRWAVVFAATLVRYPLRPVELLASLADLAELFAQPPETFTPELSTGRSPFPLSGITMVATEQAPPVGLAPTGTTIKPRCTESHHDVVRESHHDDIAVRTLLTPCLDPQIEYVMKIDVRQKRRSTAALRRPFLCPYPFPILQHARVEPFLDHPHDAPVCDPVLDELHQPFVRNSIEEAFDVQVEHPVHFSRQQSRVQCVQRLMLAAPWSEPVRETKKIRFIDSVQHLDRRALDDFVFQRRNSERSLPPVGLRDKHPTHRLRSIRSSLQPFGKILEASLQRLAVVPPRLPVHARRGFLLQSEVGHAQRVQVVDVVQERREPQLLILSCCLTYPLQRTRRVFPARCPGRVLLWQVPFGQSSSLHPLRHRLPGFVRRLLRYYRAVRLPRSVRHRRTSLDFPMRPRANATLDELGISRFPREVSPYVHRVSDRAGLWHTSRYRCTRCCLPLAPTASASRSKCLTRLNTRPIRSPVNASTPPLRAAPHDSGPMWVATSHSYDFCIHYTSPVLTGAQERQNE